MRLNPLTTYSPLTGATRPVTGGLLRDTYLAPRTGSWPFSEALHGRSSPWSESLRVDPEATSRSVEAALTMVIRSTSNLSPSSVRADRLPDSRARQHLSALHDLWKDMDGALPEDLAVYRHVMAAKADDALEPLPLLDGYECLHTDVAERALTQALITHHGVASAEARAEWRDRHPQSHAVAAGALGHVQAHLYGAVEAAAKDDTLSVIGLRDPNEEAEFAAACIQRMLDDGTISSPADAGVLAPDDAAYHLALGQAFDRCGLRLTDVTREPAVLDQVGTLLSALLAVLKGPAPRTALATIHASPLMPWSPELGRQMAREIIERGHSRAARAVEGQGRVIIDALGPVGTDAQLFARLFAVAGALRSSETMQMRIGELRAAIAPGNEIDWPSLTRLAQPRSHAVTPSERFVDGVTILAETQLPWRAVRQLLVLGMAGRQWPRPIAANPMFTDSEVALIGSSTGLELFGRDKQLSRGLELFRRQLCAATERATFLVPACNLKGEALPFSTGLALVSRLVGVNNPEKLVEDLRSRPEAEWPITRTTRRLLPNGGAPDLPDRGEMRLGTDLLRLRDEGDRLAPQSPSRLDVLIVSPFAWLLEELDAKDRTWAPETLDVLTLGTLVHGVLERVFGEDNPVPDPDKALAQASAALDDTIAHNASWLASSAWEIERASLLREAQECVQRWARFLRDVGATVLSNEISLAGEYHGLRIAGRADTVLSLPDGRLMVVDHKRESSEKRRKRMALGWDLQVALYRAMLEQPETETELSPAADDGRLPVTAYHLTRDGVVLVDETGAGIPRTDCASTDASGAALANLTELVQKARAGHVTLNCAGDEKRFEKERGLRAYALRDNELVRAFLIPEPEGTADE